MLFFEGDKEDKIPEELKESDKFCKGGGQRGISISYFTLIIENKDNIICFCITKNLDIYMSRGFIVFSKVEYNKDLYDRNKQEIIFKVSEENNLQTMVKVMSKLELTSVGQEPKFPEFIAYGLNIALICLDYTKKLPGGIKSPRGTSQTPHPLNINLETILNNIVEWTPIEDNEINYISLESVLGAYLIYEENGFIPFKNDIEFLNIIREIKTEYSPSPEFKSKLIIEVEKRRKRIETLNSIRSSVKIAMAVNKAREKFLSLRKTGKTKKIL